MHHAIGALRIAAFVSVVFPLRFIEQLLVGFRVAFLQQVTRALPAEDVVARHAPRGAIIVNIALEEFEEVRRQIKDPRFLAAAQDGAEEFLGLFTFEEVLLVGSFLVAVTGGKHHAFDAKAHDIIKEITDILRIGSVEKSGIGRNTEAAFDRFFNGFDGSFKSAIAADGLIMMLAVAVEVNAKGEIFRGLKEIHFLLQQQRVGAKINVFFPRDETIDDFVDFIVDEGFATGDADHRSTALISGGPALLGREAFIKNVVRVLDFSATGTGEITAEKRLEHEHEGIVAVTFQLLINDVAGDSPLLGDGNHSPLGCKFFAVNVKQMAGDILIRDRRVKYKRLLARLINGQKLNGKRLCVIGARLDPKWRDGLSFVALILPAKHR